MFGELPKILDRNFLIGYLLPGAGFVIADVTIGVWIKWWTWSDFIVRHDKVGSLELSLFSYILAFLALTIALVLLILNRGIIRLLEGYTWIHPPNGLEKFRFRRLNRRIERLENRYREDPNGPSAGEILQLRSTLMRKRVTRFPDSEQSLLPTAFGNAVRAFETYSGVMYGLDAIPGWDRLVAVVPKEHLQVVDSAKAEMDVWVNIWFLSASALLVEISIALLIGLGSAVPSLSLVQYGVGVDSLRGIAFLALGTVVAACGAASAARVAAIGWGSLVKATFDVFLLDLRTKFGFPTIASREEERAFWTEFSKAFIYHSSKNIAGLVPGMSEPSKQGATVFDRRRG